MKKIAIKFLLDEEKEQPDLKAVAQQLQRFIIEDDYRLSTITKKILSAEMIVLDIGMEEAMPLFEDAVDEFYELGVKHQLYTQNTGEWIEIEYEVLQRELDRTPKWLLSLIGFNLLWFVVMSLVQFFPIFKFYDEKYDMGILLTLLSTFISGIVPLVSSTLAYWGATDVYDWTSSNALFAFFGYYLPLLGFIFYLMYLYMKALYSDKWYRFWRPEFN